MVLPVDPQADDAQAVNEDPVLVRLAVCWSALPLAQDLTRLYGGSLEHAAGQRVSFDITPGNTENTLGRIFSGSADLAIVGGQPDPSALPRSQNGAFETRLLATDAIAVIVARDAPLQGLSQDELAGLLSGRYADWQELGAGRGYPEPVIREEGAATRALVMQRLLGQGDFASTALILPHDQGIVAYVAEHPLAIGFVSAALVDERVKVIPIDGLLPADATVRSGQYPMTLPLVAIIPSPASRPVAELLKLTTSSRGRLAIDRYFTPPR